MAEDNNDLLAMTAHIVAAFVENNHVGAEKVPALISTIHGSLSRLGGELEPVGEEVEQPTAAQIRKSITEEGIVSFLDGQKYHSLKRHLTRHAMTPQEYRSRYGLDTSYPMTSPAYSARRSELAKASGLGQKGRQPKAEAAAKPVRKSRTPKA